MQILAQLSTLQRITVPLGDMNIIVNPFLNENRQDRCQKTEDVMMDHGPLAESIYTDTRRQWIEGRGRGWRRKNRTCGALKNLREDGQVLSEVIHHLIHGADLQVLFAIDNERCQRGRK